MRIFYAVENDSSTGVMLFLRKLSDDVIVNAADENGYLWVNTGMIAVWYRYI